MSRTPGLQPAGDDSPEEARHEGGSVVFHLVPAKAGWGCFVCAAACCRRGEGALRAVADDERVAAVRTAAPQVRLTAWEVTTTTATVPQQNVL